MNSDKAPQRTAGAPNSNGAAGGTGRGSGSALDAMLRKRREGENQTVEEPADPVDNQTASQE